MQQENGIETRAQMEVPSIANDKPEIVSYTDFLRAMAVAMPDRVDLLRVAAYTVHPDALVVNAVKADAVMDAYEHVIAEMRKEIERLGGAITLAANHSDSIPRDSLCISEEMTIS